MARIAEGMGARILRNTSVEEMLFEGRRAVGVRSDGEADEVIKADVIVVNADFAQAMQRLVPKAFDPPRRNGRSGRFASGWRLSAGSEEEWRRQPESWQRQFPHFCPAH
jgi:phytoene dehydrogenase-like protein